MQLGSSKGKTSPGMVSAQQVKTFSRPYLSYLCWSHSQGATSHQCGKDSHLQLQEYITFSANDPSKRAMLHSRQFPEMTLFSIFVYQGCHNKGWLRQRKFIFSQLRRLASHKSHAGEKERAREKWLRILLEICCRPVRSSVLTSQEREVRNAPSLLPMSGAVRESGYTTKTQGPSHTDQPIQVTAGFLPIITAPFHLLRKLK